jgi:transglutaminase-like putative cysteine protease
MRLFRPLPRAATRAASLIVLLAWGATMAVLVERSYIRVSSASLATDLARYGSSAVWRGVYYRGDKIGFTVTQTLAEPDGFELDEDGRLQMSLLGAPTPATLHTAAHVDSAFALHAFEFSLDPGTGAIEISGRVTGRRMSIAITTAGGATTTEEREFDEPPALSVNLSRRLAAAGLTAGARYQWMLFDPATLRNAPVTIEVGKRELVRSAGKPLPAFRVEMEFAGLRTTSWITDTGDVVREESPLGLITVRETPENARATAVSGRIQSDLLETAAVVPAGDVRIDDPREVRRLRLRLDGADLSALDLQGAGQRTEGRVLEIDDAATLRPSAADHEAHQYLAPEPLIESDDPAIRAEAAIAVRGVNGSRARAERLTRYVNGLLEKKPTISLPSAREVLRTKVGDCNEHTALFVAMARAAGLPARVAVGLVYVKGAFYYHAWPEVYLDEGARGMWLPVDPTLNQFPADATHVRLARGGLDRQATILPLVGRLRITILDVDIVPGSTPILAGSRPLDLGALAIPLHRRDSCCACR